MQKEIHLTLKIRVFSDLLQWKQILFGGNTVLANAENYNSSKSKIGIFSPLVLRNGTSPDETF